jgi:hypothetical protein
MRSDLRLDQRNEVGGIFYLLCRQIPLSQRTVQSNSIADQKQWEFNDLT